MHLKSVSCSRLKLDHELRRKPSHLTTETHCDTINHKHLKHKLWLFAPEELNPLRNRLPPGALVSGDGHGTASNPGAPRINAVTGE